MFIRSFLSAISMVALPPALATAATIEVDTFDDDPAMGCTLREALDSANADAAAGNGCADGDGADRILLATGTYAVDDVLVVTSEVTVVGRGRKDPSDVLESLPGPRARRGPIRCAITRAGRRSPADRRRVRRSDAATARNHVTPLRHVP